MYYPGATPLSAVEGDVFTRQWVTVPADSSYTLEFTCDDLGELFVDGQQILTISSTGGYGSTFLPFTAGDHLIAVHVHNWFPSPYFGTFNPGYYAWSMKRGGGIYLAPTPLAHSDGSAKLVRIDADPPTTVPGQNAPIQSGPGMTPGTVIRLLVDEAQARGELEGCLAVSKAMPSGPTTEKA